MTSNRPGFWFRLSDDYIPQYRDLHPDGDRVLAVQSESAFGAQRLILVLNWAEELRQRTGN